MDANREYFLIGYILDLYSEGAGSNLCPDSGCAELVSSTFSSTSACEYWNTAFK
jgi:hypothetical protein